MKTEQAKEKIDMIRAILKELEAMNGVDGDGSSDEREAEAAIPPTDWIGKRVRVLSKKHKDKLGIVTKRRGKLFWWIRTDDGKEFYRKHTTLELIEEYKN